jgi:hypothetical protein
MGPDNLRRSWGRIRAAVGLQEVRFHSARHTCVSVLLVLGIPPNIVREVVGHSDIEVTMTIYAHASGRHAGGAAEAGVCPRLRTLSSEAIPALHSSTAVGVLFTVLVSRDHGGVDRIFLAGLLDRDGEAHAACLRAVLDGASFSIGERGVRTDELVSIYRVREEHTREIGLPTLGFAEALADLRACGYHQLALGGVDQVDPPFHFVLFLSLDCSQIVACVGVDQDPRHRALLG